jgi:hypothetical protein
VIAIPDEAARVAASDMRDSHLPQEEISKLACVAISATMIAS